MTVKPCMRCGARVESASPRVYCEPCRKAVRAEYDTRKNRRYYREHSTEVRARCARTRSHLTKMQRRRYADTALDRYYRNKETLERFRMRLPPAFLKGLSVVSSCYEHDPVFVFELRGKKRREALNEPLPEWAPGDEACQT